MFHSIQKHYYIAPKKKKKPLLPYPFQGNTESMCKANQFVDMLKEGDESPQIVQIFEFYGIEWGEI